GFPPFTPSAAQSPGGRNMLLARTTSSARRTRRLAATAAIATTLALALAPAPARGQREEPGLAKFLDALELRELGPAVMGGRVSDIAVDPTNPTTYYIGFASGGLWKTDNQGMTWTPLFDDQPTASIGAVTVAP